MIYVSIDIETTGLDRQNDQVLEVGAVIEDTEKQLYYEEIPKFNAILKYDRLSGSPFALSLNARILEILKNIPRKSDEARPDYMKEHNIINPEDLGLAFFTFLTSNGYEETEHGDVRIITAGKNFASFDRPFLENIPNFTEYVKMGHRCIDPVNHYIDFMNDTDLPSLNVCMERAGVEGEVTHKAVEDAWDVVRVLREKYV
jgi:DNA polymerase III epsilon subunit-like protein